MDEVAELPNDLAGFWWPSADSPPDGWEFTGREQTINGMTLYQIQPLWDISELIQ